MEQHELYKSDKDQLATLFSIDIDKLSHVRTVTRSDDLHRHRTMTRKIFQLSCASRVGILTNKPSVMKANLMFHQIIIVMKLVEYKRHSFILVPYRLSTTT